MKNKLKIGIFLDAFYPMVDGVILVVDNYAKILSKSCDVTVVCPKSKKLKKEIDRPYNIVRCESIEISSMDYSIPLPIFDLEFLKIYTKFDFDIVHIHSPFTIGNIGVEYAKRKKIPAVGTFHSQYRQDFYKKTKSKLLSEVLLNRAMAVFNKTNLCYSVNEKIKEVYYDYGAGIETRVRYNGTDLVPFTDEDKLVKLKDKYSVKDQKVFLFVGRINEIKNIFFIIDVMKILKDQKFKYKMLFIGSGEDEERLRAAIKELDLLENVIMVGRIMDREELASYYALADLFVFPSLYDSSSLVQIEAASQKTPALFIKGAVTADTIIPDINGYVSEDDIYKYSDKIVQIFSDESKYEFVCNNAFRDLYRTWDEVVEKTYNDYLELIKNYHLYIE
jgi:glycosyltransferase involved in cell wall biosynthesis